MVLTIEVLASKKKDLEMQLAQIQSDINQFTANGNAVAGAIQFCEDLIKSLEEEKNKTSEKKPAA